MNFINFNKKQSINTAFLKVLLKKIISQIKTFIGGTENDDIDF